MGGKNSRESYTNSYDDAYNDVYEDDDDYPHTRQGQRRKTHHRRVPATQHTNGLNNAYYNIPPAQPPQRTLPPAHSKVTYCKQVRIANGSRGHGYDTIFADLLDSKIRSVEVDDPYVINMGQILNFVRLCELFVSKCPNVKRISLSTKRDEKGDPKDQLERFAMLRNSLASFGVTFAVAYSFTLHDREIRLDNGWVVSLGRGLDYFKPVQGRFCIGSFDLNLRPCNETTVNIFRRDSAK